MNDIKEILYLLIYPTKTLLSNSNNIHKDELFHGTIILRAMYLDDIFQKLKNWPSMSATNDFSMVTNLGSIIIIIISVNITLSACLFISRGIYALNWPSMSGCKNQSTAGFYVYVIGIKVVYSVFC